jgi:hypothetical protein
MRYYFKMLWLLYKLPIKLRYSDIEELAKQVQEMRISQQELEDYIEFCRSKFKNEDVVD